jgi:CheY-like chemotaxis protein
MPPTVLLADDSLTIQRVVSLTFADQAIRVVVAKDGQDAINRMASERPDLVLADTNMPCVDGYELARWVRQQPHLNSVPVLLLAGATDPVDEQRLHDSGANGVLEKPFEPSHVISRVKELLGLKTPPAPSSTRLVTSAEAKPAKAPMPARPAGSPAGPERGEAAAAPPASPPLPTPSAPIDTRSGTSAPAKPGSGIFRTIATVADAPQPVRVAVPPLEPAPPAAAVDEGSSRSSAAAAAPSNAADVFESLLAAEQGDPAATEPAAIGPAARATPEMLDRLSAETRAAVAEAVQAAINGSVLGSIRGAVNEAIAAALPAAIAEASERIERAVREVVAHEIRELVHDTAERQVRDEIARIRGRQ